MRRTELRQDEGATLVLVLAFVAVFGVLISVVLGQTDTSLKRSLVTRSNLQKVYAADAGIEAGVLKLRTDDTSCVSTGTLLTTTVNGRPVTVTCTPVSGSALGAKGYALITTAASDSLETQSGVGGLKKISGHVFATSLGTVDLRVERGDVTERKSGSTCASDSDQPGGLTVGPTPPFRYSCEPQDWTALDPAPALGTAPAPHPLPTADRVIGTGASACHVFRPGTYSSGIVFGPRNYFTSGVYYFPTGDVRVTSADLVGGAPGPGEPQINDRAGCADDSALAATSPGGQTIQGTGVKIVLGGTARLIADNPGGEIELFTRTGGPSGEGAPGVSVHRVPASPPVSVPAWIPSTVPLSTPLVAVGTGTTPDLALHGLVYVPGGFMDFNATNNVQAQLIGGVVAGRFYFQSSASASGINIALGSGPGRRRVQLDSVATGTGRDVRSRALLDVENDTNRTASVIRWSTDQS